eukprot:GHVU01062097.1.p1 GENE.GHVU01062097.1~~GHVU01062097.1.p1  ORF type:complete len:124 (-),score=16.81 GHVU01062097.1:121-492(-)
MKAISAVPSRKKNRVKANEAPREGKRLGLKRTFTLLEKIEICRKALGEGVPKVSKSQLAKDCKIDRKNLKVWLKAYQSGAMVAAQKHSSKACRMVFSVKQEAGKYPDVDKKVHETFKKLRKVT